MNGVSQPASEQSYGRPFGEPKKADGALFAAIAQACRSSRGRCEPGLSVLARSGSLCWPKLQIKVEVVVRMKECRHVILAGVAAAVGVAASIAVDVAE